MTKSRKNQATMALDEFQAIFDGLVEQLAKENALSDDQTEELELELVEEYGPMTDHLADVLLKGLDDRANRMLIYQRRAFERFRKRHFNLWKPGFDALEALILASLEIGASFNARYRVEDAKSDALTRIHARACHVAQEVLHLLRDGFADGAHARWRTCHELAVVGAFISQHAEGLAQRFMEYEAIESYKAMVQYEKYVERLGLVPGTVDEKEFVTSRRDACIGKYGKAFGEDFGWAAVALQNERPNFSQIELAVGLDHMRPYYKLASNNVHANSKGVQFRLGLQNDEEMLLAGPSNFGLTDPAHGAALSLMQITSFLLGLRTNLDALVYSKMLMKMADRVGHAFLDIQLKMESGFIRLKSGGIAPPEEEST